LLAFANRSTRNSGPKYIFLQVEATSDSPKDATALALTAILLNNYPTYLCFVSNSWIEQGSVQVNGKICISKSNITTIAYSKIPEAPDLQPEDIPRRPTKMTPC